MQATFFMIGKHADAHPDLAKQTGRCGGFTNPC
jgi:peptidoglycan/xylan/chitin deacetylase (PgdA/CDA1 family)